MEYMGLDKIKFTNFMKELVVVYTDISKEKAKIYYDFFITEKITIEQLEKTKHILFKTKTSGWFPTIAEIYNIAKLQPKISIENLTEKEKIDLLENYNLGG